MKEIDDTEIEEGMTIEGVWHWAKATEKELLSLIRDLRSRVLVLEKEVTLLLEQRETARAPEGGEVDPEWYGSD